MSAFTKPFLIRPGEAAIALERIPLAVGDNEGRSERWLQEALFASPECLPIKEIDPHIGPLIPVCMEIETGSGPADILYVTPTGQVVLVETKLWRNPQARREVVGQILDYAKHLTTWDYEILNQKAATAARSQGDHLLRCLKVSYPETDEASFVEGVERSLLSGDFLLLIVGDGIRYGAESLVGFLEKYGHLEFGFGLIEVAAYKLPDGRTLLQPRILAKTEVLKRTILVGPNGPVEFQQLAQAEDAVSPNIVQREWFATFWAEVLAKLNLDDRSSLPADPAKSTNQFFAMPPYSNLAWMSAFIAQASHKAGVYLTFAKSYDQGMQVYETLEVDKEAIERELGAPLTWERSNDKVYIGAPNAGFTDLNIPAERERVIAFLADMVPRMIRVFKPRLEAATKDQVG